MINFNNNTSYDNFFLNFKLSTREQTNSNSNSTTSTNSNSKSSNVANEVLGYKVDKEGYFTEEFNKVAKISQDYKIHSSTMESLVRVKTNKDNFFRTFDSVDIAKTMGSAYKILSQVVGEDILNSKDSFTRDEIAQFPQGYEYSIQSLEVFKIYDTSDELYNAMQGYNDKKAAENKEGINSLFFNFSYDKPVTNIFDNHNAGKESVMSGVFWDSTAEKYMGKDGSVTKGGLLIAVLNSNLHAIEGETTAWGKATGYDKTLSYEQGLANLSIVNQQFAEMAEKSFGTDSSKNDNDEWFNFKDPIQSMLEELQKLNKKMAQKAKKRKIDIKA